MPDTDLLIVGSGPAAWSCAMTARKRDLSVTVAAAQSSASWLWRTDRIDNYPGMPQVSGQELLRVFRSQAEDLGARVIECPARLIQPMGDTFMTMVGNDIIESRAVVLAMGAARPRLLPGEDELVGQGVSWCGTCDGMFFRGREVAVISAWTGGAEEAMFLASLASRVDYFTLSPHTLPNDERIRLREGTPTALSRTESGRIAVTTEGARAEYDGVFVFRPSVAPDRLLPGLALNGPFIEVDRRMAANIPMVYACGDCTGKPLQIAKAVGEGNIAAISVAEDLAGRGEQH